MRRGSRLWLAAGHGALGVPWPIILVFLCCVLPLGWLVGQLALNPQVWVEMGLEPHRWRLLGRTLGYNAAVAVLAVLLGLPGALVLGRGRSWGARLLAVVLPLCLLLPSLAYAYGWSQFTHLAEEPMGRLALALPE